MTDAGSDKPNEDLWGAHGDLLWAFDGATGLGESAESDTSAARLVGALDAGLRESAGSSLDLAELVQGVITSAVEQLPELGGIPREARPTASGVVARLLEDRLEYLACGDVDLIHLSGRRLYADRDRASIERERAFVAGGDLRGELRRRRRRLNQPGGYYLFAAGDDVAVHLRRHFISFGPGDRLLLATDGIMRLVDVFGRYDEQGLWDRVSATGSASLLHELRELETHDAGLAKLHDDATWVFAEAVGS